MGHFKQYTNTVRSVRLQYINICTYLLFVSNQQIFKFLDIHTCANGKQCHTGAILCPYVGVDRRVKY